MNDPISTRTVSGEEPEFTSPGQWVEQYGDYLYNFALGQVRNDSVAEDLVQETFLAALKARDRFSGQSSERTWLVSILRHKICDHFRRNSRRPTVSLSASDDDIESGMEDAVRWVHEVAAECLEPHRRLELQEFRESLQTALGKLPPRIAQAFELYEIEEQSGREVCARLNISEQNLWVMLHRARKQLRDELLPWKASSSRRNSAHSND